MRFLLVLASSLFTVACSTAYPKLAVHDVAEVAKAPVREWRTTALAAGAVAATVLVDDELADLARRNQSDALGEVFETVEPLGGGASDKVIAGFLLYGFARDDDRAKNVAFDAFVSHLIASRGITPALKAAVHRDRPNGTGDSFPSNHATQAFAVATVIASHYERPWVRWAAYGLATGVGLARVYHDAHWTSDVVAGAIIGTFVGRTVVTTNKRERTRWVIEPIVDAGRRGVRVRVVR
jgi:membrane-associated phospholipid phosphatase